MGFASLYPSYAAGMELELRIPINNEVRLVMGPAFAATTRNSRCCADTFICLLSSIYLRVWQDAVNTFPCRLTFH